MRSDAATVDQYLSELAASGRTASAATTRDYLNDFKLATAIAFARLA